MQSEKVFISYSRANAERVKDLKQILQYHGVEFWIDHEQLQPGMPDWAEAVDFGIRSSKAVIYVASPEAKDSPYVHEELTLAREKYRIPICPYWIIGKDWLEAAPSGWERTQYIDARNNSDYSASSLLLWLSQYIQVTIEAERIWKIIPTSMSSKGFRVQVLNGIEVILPPMVVVPAGSFLMGSDNTSLGCAWWQHEVTLETYTIAKYPLTVAEYACFLRATNHSEPPPWNQVVDWARQRDHLDHPVVCINWFDARDYASWLRDLTGKNWRLPTEAEWEKAARGIDGRIYPWGNTWEDNHANTALSGWNTTTPIGSYPEGGSPYGCMDMSGNVYEWTSSLFRQYPYRNDVTREDPDSKNSRVVRGGGWVCGLLLVSTPYRVNVNPSDIGDVCGARLACL